MSFAEDDDMVKTFPPDRANQSFRMAILPWRLRRGWPVADAHGTKPPGENFAIDRIAIADDVLWHPFPAAVFGELSDIPSALGCVVTPAIRFDGGRGIE